VKDALNLIAVAVIRCCRWVWLTQCIEHGVVHEHALLQKAFLQFQPVEHSPLDSQRSLLVVEQIATLCTAALDGV